MISRHRRWFNDNWTPAKYARFLDLIRERTGEPARFRHSETPLFLTSSLIGRMEQAGREMVEQLLANPEYLIAARAAIPEQYRVANEAAAPLFVQADFGLDENGDPKLVEIQGFPSLYSYQPVMASCYRDAYGLTAPYTFPSDYRETLRRAIVGDCDPENVVLLEVEPEKQKTLCDFIVTEQQFGVKAVDIARMVKRGNKLFTPDDTPIHRIYNRAIVDEIARKGIQLPFDWRDDLDVEWAGHPNWFFLLSKFSMPWLKHEAVPETLPVRQVPDPQNWVLKPLWSFAGLGVTVGPTADQIQAAIDTDPEGYILQRRVDFRPFIETPHGLTKAEIRIMYIDLQPVNIIVRMGRGAQMGVDHNKGLEWVGASAAFLGD